MGLLLLSLTVATLGYGEDKRKPTIQVARCESQLPTWQPAMGEALADLLITELTRLDNLQVLESVALDDLREERSLGEMGEVAEDERVRRGQWKGADYTFKAVITRFGAKESEVGGGGLIPSSFPFVRGGVVMKKREHEIQIDWRIVDNVTRVLVKSGRATGVEKGGGFNFASWNGGGFSQSREFGDSALGKATMKAIASIAATMGQWEAPAISGRAEVAGKEAAERERNVAASQAEKRQVRGEVLMVDDDKVWLSLGTEQGMQEGDRVRIYRAIEKRTGGANSWPSTISP